MASIRKRKNKYQVQIRRNGFPDLSKSFEQLRDAKEWARYTEIQLDRNELAPNRKELDHISLGDLVIRYRDTVLPEKRSQEVETIILNAFLRHPICRKPLLYISTSDFAQYRDQRLSEISPISLKRQLAPIHNMYEVAKAEWGVPLLDNPLSNLKLKNIQNGRNRRLREGEIETLLEAGKNTKNPLVIPVVLFALESSLRRGEILSLHWDQIDLKRSLATTLEAKNGYSRTIPLSPKACEILTEMREFHERELGKHKLPEENCPSNVIGIGISRLIDTGYLGNNISYDSSNLLSLKGRVFPITSNALRLAWVRLCKRAGIEDLHFHDLRHEAVSRFFELGLTVPEVASISGHRDLRMLMRYAHANQKSVQRKLSGIVNGS